MKPRRLNRYYFAALVISLGAVLLIPELFVLNLAGQRPTNGTLETNVVGWGLYFLNMLVATYALRAFGITSAPLRDGRRKGQPVP